MYSLSLKDLQTLSGLPVHIIRLWENRHELLQKVALRQRQRRYTDEMLKRFLRLSILHHQDWKTTELATLSDSEIAEATKPTMVQQPSLLVHVQLLLIAAIDLDEAAFTHALNQVVAQLGIEQAIATVCHPYLSQLSILSPPNKTLSAKQHFSAYLLRARLLAETEKLPRANHSSPQTGLFSPANSANELPLLYLNYSLRKRGWNVLYLGQNKKINEVAKAIDFAGLAYLWVHLERDALPISLEDYLTTLRRQFPDQTLIISGHGVTQTQRSFIKTYLLQNDAEIEAFIQTYPFGTT